MDDRATAIPVVSGLRLDEPQPQKEEPKTYLCHATQHWARTFVITQTKTHIMPHVGHSKRCTTVPLMVWCLCCEQFGRKYMALTTKLLKDQPGVHLGKDLNSKRKCLYTYLLLKQVSLTTKTTPMSKIQGCLHYTSAFHFTNSSQHIWRRTTLCIT